MNRKMQKILSAVLVPFMLVSMGLSTFAKTNYLYDSYTIRGDMKAIAHRGYSAIAPENTLPAFRLAGEYGFWGAECDVHLTADGVWVICHDGTIDRTTDGEGLIMDMTYDELMQYTVDAGCNVENYPDLKIPRLVDYLDICNQYGLHAVIEIKYEENTDLDSLAQLLSSREEKQMFVIISFDREALVGMKKLMPDTPMYLLEGLSTKESVDFCVGNGIEGLDLSGVESIDVLDYAFDSGIDVIAWTVDDVELAEKYYEHGVRSITTNSLVPKLPPKGRLLRKIVWKLENLIDAIKAFLILLPTFYNNINNCCKNLLFFPKRY